MLEDIRFAIRAAHRSPGLVIAATCTIALGIGAITATFSVISGVLLRPLPFAHPDRLVQINQNDARNGTGPVFWSDLQEWRRQNTSFEQMTTYVPISRILDTAGAEAAPEPERVQALWAERGLFRTLGVAPLSGRTFRDDDPADVAVLGAGLCERLFGEDASCTGRKITLDREPYTIIGVMPGSFRFPYRDSFTEVWIPWTMPAQQASSRYSRLDFVLARLKSGATIESARRELAVIAARLEKQYPDSNKGRRAMITPLAEAVAGPVRVPLLTLLGAVGLVLLIACANVANLLLAHAARRTHEIAVRAALGASRGRLVRQLLTENVLRSIAGGCGGLLLAVAGTRTILKFASSKLPRAWEIGWEIGKTDWRVFAFLLLATLATGVVFGILPALTASRTGPHTALQQAGARWSVGSGAAGWSGWRLRDGLVVAEIALSFVLLVSAGLLLRAFLRLEATPPGLAPDHVLTMRMTVALKDYTAPGSYGRYLGELEDSLGKVPGVRAAGFIQFLPLQNWGWFGFFSIRGRPQPQAPQPQAELRYVTAGYFKALRIPLRAGRLFTDRDTAQSPLVILVNEALAHRYFPNEDPVGRVTDRGIIAGVVGDVHTSRLDRPATPEIYYSFVQNTAATSEAGVSLAVNTAPRPEALAKAVRDAIHRVNPHQALYDVATMDRVIADSLADTTLYVRLIGLFAGLALLLAVSGIYAVISYLVTARTQEFGIRLALGAEPAQIVRLVLRRGSKLVAYGMVLGAAGTLAATRLLGSLIGSVTAADPSTLVAVAALLSGVGLLASAIPALRAMRVDPGVTLKYE
jgi:predicted permease